MKTSQQLIDRIVDITYRHKLSHLSSTISAMPIIKEIYDRKAPDEIFILSSGHAGLAQYVIIEDRYGIDAEMLLEKHGIHPNRDLENHICCSTGSLGSGLPIAVGHALSDKTKNVYCLISDGECAEGSIWESLQFIYVQHLLNLKVYVNINGQSAFEYLDRDYLIRRLRAFLPVINIRESGIPNYGITEGLESHYHVIRGSEKGHGKF
jgi:transketolase